MYRCGWKVEEASDGRITFVRGSGGVRGPNGSRLWEWLLYIEKRRKAVSKSKRKVATDSAFAKAFPATWEYLSVDTHKDGSSRHTSSLTIFVDEGLLKCCLSDKEAGEVAFWSADSWEELLTALEADLAAGQGDWRASKNKAKK